MSLERAVKRLHGLRAVGSRLSTGVGVNILLIAGGVSMLSWSMSTLLLPWDSMLCCESRMRRGTRPKSDSLSVALRMYRVSRSVGGRSPRVLMRLFRSLSSSKNGCLFASKLCLLRLESSFVASVVLATLRLDFLQADLSFACGWASKVIKNQES